MSRLSKKNCSQVGIRKILIYLFINATNRFKLSLYLKLSDYGSLLKN